MKSSSSMDINMMVEPRETMLTYGINCACDLLHVMMVVGLPLRTPLSDI